MASSIPALSDYLQQIHYGSLCYLELSVGLPEYDPTGEIELDLISVREKLTNILRRNQNNQYYTVDYVRNYPDTLRVLVDTKAPKNCLPAYTHVRITFRKTDVFQVDEGYREWSEGCFGREVLQHRDSDIYSHCFHIANLAAEYNTLEWHINQPEKDAAFIDAIKDIFVGWGFDDKKQMDKNRFPTLDAEESVILKRGDIELLVLLDRRVTVMGKNRFMVVTT